MTVDGAAMDSRIILACLAAAAAAISAPASAATRNFGITGFTKVGF